MFQKNKDRLQKTVNDFSTLSQWSLHKLFDYLNMMPGLMKTEAEVTRGEDGSFEDKPVDIADKNLVNVIMRTLITSGFTDTDLLKTIQMYDSLETDIVYLRAIFGIIKVYSEFYANNDCAVLSVQRKKICKDMIDSLFKHDRYSHIKVVYDNPTPRRSRVQDMDNLKKAAFKELFKVVSGDESLKDHHGFVEHWERIVWSENYDFAIQVIEGRQKHFPLLEDKIKPQMCKIKSITEMKQMIAAIYRKNDRSFCAKIQVKVDWIHHTEKNPLKVTEDGDVVYPQALKDGLPCPGMEQNVCDESDDEFSSYSDDDSSSSSSSIEL